MHTENTKLSQNRKDVKWMRLYTVNYLLETKAQWNTVGKMYCSSNNEYTLPHLCTLSRKSHTRALIFRKRTFWYSEAVHAGCHDKQKPLLEKQNKNCYSKNETKTATRQTNHRCTDVITDMTQHVSWLSLQNMTYVVRHRQNCNLWIVGRQVKWLNYV